MLKRIGKVHSKIETLGDRLKSTECAFNDLIKSAEENVLKPARKMVKLGAPSSSKLKALDDVDDEVRQIAPKAIDAPDLFEDDEDLEDEKNDER